MSDQPIRNSTWPLMLLSFLSAATYVLTRALGVGLFLARVGTTHLPLTLTVAAVGVMGVSFLTRILLRYRSIRSCAAGTWFLFSLVSAGATAAVGIYPQSILLLGSLYVLAEIRGCINTVYVISLCNEMFDGAGPRRPYVLVAIGAPVAGLLFGGLLSIEAAALADTSWIAVITALDIATLCLVRWLPKIPSKRAREKAEQAREDGEQTELDQDSVLVNQLDRRMVNDETSEAPRTYRFYLASLVASKIAVLTLIGFQWKIEVEHFFGRDEASMISFFASFYAVNDVIIVLLQVFATSNLIDRVRIDVPLKLYPITLFALGVAILVSIRFPMTAENHLFIMMILYTLARGLNVIRRSFHDPALAAAYGVIDDSVRAETIVFVKGMIKPFAEAIVAVCLIFIAHRLSDAGMTTTWMLLTIPWLWFSTRVASAYRRRKHQAIASEMKSDLNREIQRRSIDAEPVSPEASSAETR